MRLKCDLGFSMTVLSRILPSQIYNLFHRAETIVQKNGLKHYERTDYH